MNHEIGTTRNEMVVTVNLTRSAAAVKISSNPHLLALAKEMLSNEAPRGKHKVVTRDMGRSIGYDFVIEVENPEDIFYAQLVKQTAYIPFTKKGDPESTQLLTLVLDRNSENGHYDLSDIWLGPPRPGYPGDALETEESKVYWKTHAHILGTESLRHNSVTRTCPY